MRVRDRGFALILVLVATATVFALAIQSGAVVRATTLETVVLQERQVAQRGSRAAAALLLKSLMGSTSALPDDVGTGSGDSQPALPDEDDLELPPIVKALLGDALGDLEEQAQDQFEEDRELLDRTAQGGGVAGSAGKVASYRLLTEAIALAEPAEVRLPDDDLIYRVSLADAGGLLSINAADERQLLAYLRAVGLDAIAAQRVTDQILDWRDEDAVTRRYGRERSQYALDGIEPRDAPFKTIEELLYLPAISTDLFQRIAADLSVGGDAMIHAGSASREVLLSVPDVNTQVVDRILSLRAEGRLTQETLESALPITASAAREMLRADSGNVLRISVTAEGDAVHRFTGIAILDDGSIAALGLRPI